MAKKTLHGGMIFMPACDDPHLVSVDALRLGSVTNRLVLLMLVNSRSFSPVVTMLCLLDVRTRAGERDNSDDEPPPWMRPPSTPDVARGTW